MPKQGHFAKSARVKQLNNFKTRRHTGLGNTIKDDQLTDFLVVRYALTVKRRVAQPAQETVQRFLIEISNQLPAVNGDLTKLLPPLVSKLNSQVPWQFFEQLLANWDLLQKFLVKELPAVPLRQRLRITKQVSRAQLAAVVARELAVKGAAATLLKQPQAAPAVREGTARLLLMTIYHGGEVDWAKVKALLAPLPYQPAADLDSATRDWLRKLSQE